MALRYLLHYSNHSLRSFPILLMTLLAAGCGQGDPAKPEKGKAAGGTHRVEAVAVAQASGAMLQTAPGTLIARRSVRVLSQEEGRIAAMPWEVGDHVEAGAVLVRLDDVLLRAQLDKAQAEAAKARADMQRIQKLAGGKLASEEQLGAARTTLAVAEAEARLLQTRLSYTEIRAPFAGLITARLTQAGDIAQKHTHLYTLEDPASLHARASVSENLAALLQPGDKAEMQIEALGDVWLPARVERVHPAVDPQSRQATVEISPSPAPEGARPGQFCRIRLALPAREQLVIPFAALRRDAAGEYVYVVAEGKVQRRAVASGGRAGADIEILDGLKPGDLVVRRGFLDLKDGKAVTLAGKPAGAAPGAASPP
jgi:membrane fusion protein (multidrug efflux system)